MRASGTGRATLGEGVRLQQAWGRRADGEVGRCQLSATSLMGGEEENAKCMLGGRSFGGGGAENGMAAAAAAAAAGGSYTGMERDSGFHSGGRFGRDTGYRDSDAAAGEVEIFFLFFFARGEGWRVGF